MYYLNKEDILEFQRELALENGGFFSATENNIRNCNAFEFVLAAPESFLFGEEQYPGIHNKAACYAYFIIKNHIFYDGNKRTGMKCALLFLELNGLTMKENVGDDTIVELALGIAENRFNLEYIANFFEINTIEFTL